MPPSECPVCGAVVPKGARSCPECGADERSGWNEEDSVYDGVDIPEEQSTEPAHGKSKPSFRYFWSVVGLALVFALLYWVLKS